MNRLSRFTLVGLIAAGLLALALIAGRALAQGPGGSGSVVPTGGSMADTMTYQGYLEWNGTPANGTFDFRVTVWSAASGGSQVGSTQVFDSPGVTVRRGFFTINTAPGNPQDVYTGAERWLQLEVRPHGVGSYTTLPRQPITNVPYAWSLRPGAVVSGSATGYALLVRNEAASAYAGSFVSSSYRGIFAHSLSGWYDGYFAGVGGIYAAGGYWSMKSGQRTIVFNGDSVALRPGDVVALAGVVESPDGGEPMLSVRRADAGHGTAVVGVVVQAVRAEMREMAELDGAAILDVQPVEGSALPGGYLAIATEGLVPAVRVDLSRGELEIGDWLTVAAAPGVAVRASPAGADDGALLGKVAGPVDLQNGTVPVFVILR